MTEAEELEREKAICLELSQQYADLLLEIIELLDTDYIPLELNNG